VLLWGTFSPLTLVGGVLVGATVTAVIRLPLAPDRLPVRPSKLLALAAYVVYDLVVSAGEVGWQSLRYGPEARGAIVAVPLLSASDRVVTVIANAFTLSPGTMVLQIDHRSGLWYVYALGPRDRAGVERVRRQAMDMQRRVLAALGSPDELAEAQRRLTVGGVEP
jgi:multicomponent Na+:H+ antiporter subunit E